MKAVRATLGGLVLSIAQFPLSAQPTAVEVSPSAWAEQIDALNGFCLSIVPEKAALQEELLGLRMNAGWNAEVARRASKENDYYQVRKFSKNGLTVELATKTRGEGASFCRAQVEVSDAERDAVSTRVGELLRKRAAVMTFNPYKFLSGHGVTAEMEWLTKPMPTRQTIMVTYYTTVKPHPF